MRKLYEINKDIEKLLDETFTVRIDDENGVNTETGEVINIAERLDALAAHPESTLLIGVDRACVRNDEALQERIRATDGCFLFRNFPGVENVRKQSRFHPRCGTSFMILVIILSIFLYAVLPWTSTGLRVVYKLCMFPLLVGLSYEVLKWAGRSHSALSRIISQPGLWMQRLTTFEPDDSMIEVAIAAVTPVLPQDREEGRDCGAPRPGIGGRPHVGRRRRAPPRQLP